MSSKNTAKKQCRFCEAKLEKTFVDLGMTPLSNANLKEEQIFGPETYLPLHVFVCAECYLVQLPEMETPDKIFDDDYAYFSSYSKSWLEHSKAYVEKMIPMLGLNRDSKVVELASNDGYLLQYFVEKGIPVLGVEPSANCAKVAIEKGVPTEIRFFGKKTAQDLSSKHSADLILGNNVLAHVPDINDFVAGIATLLKSDGVCTIEFPHLLELIENSQFDTIYHEHYSYLSLFVVEAVFARHGMTIFDVEALPTHGGSLRIFARHQENVARPVTDRLVALRQREFDYGLNKIDIYERFPEQTLARKNEFLKFLIHAKESGKSVAAYGAAAKGNTFLNFCGAGGEYIDYVVDKSPQKQNRYLPGTHIPILAPEALEKTKPDFIVVLPWNLKTELREQLAYTREWGAKLVVAIPNLEVF